MIREKTVLGTPSEACCYAIVSDGTSPIGTWCSLPYVVTDKDSFSIPENRHV